MTKTTIEALASENQFDLIGKQWMLITAGTVEKLNTMTASWGGFGWLWNKPVAFIFVRPERYTHQFIENSEYLTLSFYDQKFRPALNLCGTKSGRDIDKVKETGLTPTNTDNGSVTFAEARLTLECRKLFKSDMKESNFIDKDVLHRWYNSNPGGSLHSVYVVEIENVYK